MRDAVRFRLVLAAMAAVLAVAALATGSNAQPAPRGAIHDLGAGQALDVHGALFTAETAGKVYVAVSSEYLNVAVLSGRVRAASGAAAGAGEVLVTPINGGPAHVFGYDAAQLLASAQPAMAQEMAPLLTPIAERQRRQRWWGLLQPAPVNTQAAGPAPVEALRRDHLNDPAIIELRRQAAGDAEKLIALTAQRFASALAAGDSATVAALIDPAPFVRASADADVWRPARQRVASALSADPAARTAASAPLTEAGIGVYVLAPTGAAPWRMTLVARDGAIYVAGIQAAP